MKLIRVLILIGNLLLIVAIAYLGHYFFIKGLSTKGESGYFDPIQIVREPLETYFPKENPERKGEDRYTFLVDWVGSRPLPPPEVVIDLPEQDQALRSQVQVKSVVYNPKLPGRSGAHLFVSSVPRFFLCGDGEQLSPTLDFVLSDVKEITPNQEYILVFQKSDGKIVELEYAKSK